MFITSLNMFVCAVLPDAQHCGEGSLGGNRDLDSYQSDTHYS